MHTGRFKMVKEPHQESNAEKVKLRAIQMIQAKVKNWLINRRSEDKDEEDG